MEDWRLFVLARERKCEAFTSQQRTSSPGKLQDHWVGIKFNLSRNIALTLEGDEAVIVSGVAQLLHQVLGLLLGQLLTEVHQQLEQLELQDGVVGIFVVQLQDLNEVVEATLVLGVLAGLVHGEDIGLGQELLSLGAATSDLLDGLQGGVQVAGADEVANVEGVDLAVSLEVIDVKGEVDGINLLLLQTKLLKLQRVIGKSNMK